MKLGTIASTLTAAVLGAAVLAAPAAHAERARFVDPADASASLTDIRGVVVDHRASALVVKVGFTDLRSTSDAGPAGLVVAIDTRPARRGPEFRLTTGLQSGTDYQLMRVRDGQAVGNPLSCAHRVRLDFAADRLTFTAARSCLGSPASVRIAMKMRDEWDASHPITDWLGAPRSWTPWLARS